MNESMEAPLASLVISRFRPDLVRGGAALRNLQNIRGLARLGPVDVLTVEEDQPGDALLTLEGIREWRRFSMEGSNRSLAGRIRAKRWWWSPQVHPMLDRYEKAGAVSWLQQRLREGRYQWVVIEELALARYAEVCRRMGCRVVFDAHNVEGTLRKDLAAARRGNHRTLRTCIKERILRSRLRGEERRAVREADVVWACSTNDAIEIDALYGKKAVVVPNGVDVESYRCGRAGAVGGDWSGKRVTLLFTGSFSYYPNEEAALRLIHEVLPEIRRKWPDARLLLVGRDPRGAMRAAARDDEGIVATGEVPSVLPFLHAECVMVVPLTLGSGTRLKILEAFAAGVPVVSTRKGAEGIEAEDGFHLLLRDDPKALARAACELWENPELRQRIVENALELVARSYSWPVAAERIAGSLNGATSGKVAAI